MAKIYVAGHRGMVGGAILRRLEARGEGTLITRSSAELDLRDQAVVRAFMQTERPDAVILAAAKVGGIHANNTYPADFIYDNLLIQANVIGQAHEAGVQRRHHLQRSVRRSDPLASAHLHPTMATLGVGPQWGAREHAVAVKAKSTNARTHTTKHHYVI